jgi:hypothetical protein
MSIDAQRVTAGLKCCMQHVEQTADVTAGPYRRQQIVNWLNTP